MLPISIPPTWDTFSLVKETDPPASPTKGLSLEHRFLFYPFCSVVTASPTVLGLQNLSLAPLLGLPPTDTFFPSLVSRCFMLLLFLEPCLRKGFQVHWMSPGLRNKWAGAFDMPQDTFTSDLWFIRKPWQHYEWSWENRAQLWSFFYILFLFCQGKV